MALALLPVHAQAAAQAAPAGPAPSSGDTGADAAGCLPAGGATTPYTVNSAKVVEGAQLVLAGGGWGHGVGMSQYGAQGAAQLGCSTATILKTYYPGTQLAVLGTQRSTIAVHLLKRSLASTTIRSTTASAGGGDLPWMDCELDGTTCVVAALQPAGAEWSVTPRTDGTFVLANPGVDPASCPVSAGAPGSNPTAAPTVAPAGCHWRGGDIETRLRMVHDGTVIRILDANGRRVKWGFTEFDFSSKDGGVTYVTQYVTGDQATGRTALDRYLYGLGEMPSSWKPAALRAQAIAGRSYAEATIATREAVYGRDPVGGYIDRNECRCDLFATTVDQVYGGFDHESAETGQWRQAVEATAATVMTYANKPVAAFYSSSHGGSSEDVEHVWGSKLAYLPAVDNSRWEKQISASNSRDRWTASFTPADLANRFGLARVNSFSIDKRGPGGRPTRLDGGGVTVTGTSATGTAVTLRLSGESLRSKLSLFSSLAWVNSGSATTPSPSPSPSSQPSTVDISPACPSGQVPEDGASDVPEGSTHEAAVDCVVWWDIDHPGADGRFEAARAIRRDEMAQWLLEVLRHTNTNLPTNPPNAYPDDDGNPHEFAINSLAYLALVGGYSDGTYRPAAAVSRAQMTTFLRKVLERVEGADLPGGGNPFSDDDGTAHETSITRLYNAGVAAGVAPGRFDIVSDVSRSQMASFVARVLARLVTGGHAQRPS